MRVRSRVEEGRLCRQVGRDFSEEGKCRDGWGKHVRCRD